MEPRTVPMGQLKELVGQEVGVSDYVTITQSQINQFADVTGDHQWIHVDQERAAKESPYGRTIAHGFLSLSLMGTIAAGAFRVTGHRMGVNYGLDRVRFPAPVLSESRVRARVSIISVDDIAGGVQLKLSVVIEAEGRTKPACAAEWLLRYYN